jgi:hypothetical protein
MFKSDKPIKAAMQYIVEPLIENPLAASVDFLACKSCQVSTDIFHRYVSTWLFKAEGKLVGYIGCGIMMVITEKYSPSFCIGFVDEQFGEAILPIMINEFFNEQ